MIQQALNLPPEKMNKFYLVCNNLFAHQWIEYDLRKNNEPTLDMFEDQLKTVRGWG